MKFSMHQWVGKCWKWCHNKSLGQLILRLVLGSYFLGHAIAKFQNMPSTVLMFNGWGFATVWAYVATIAELIVGVAIVLGVALWFAAALLVVLMGVAIYAVVEPSTQGEPLLYHFIFYWGPNLIYVAAAVALAFTGPGKWSLSAWLMRRYHTVFPCKECKMGSGMTCACMKDESGAHATACDCRLCGCEKQE